MLVYLDMLVVPSKLKHKKVSEAVIFPPGGRGDLKRRYWG